MTITRLLVANRGEIARRVFRTCRELGIGTVAVYSDVDAGALFVEESDAAVRLPGNSPTDTYLRGDLVIEAARRAGADAVHPGYGFLSENADFARAVIAAGLTWVGPRPGSMEQMASKVEAKKLMETSGVPVLANLDAEQVTEADLPVLVKASAGGGGRGMRVARSIEALPELVSSAQDEAASAFGDGAIFIERYVERGRHVEVQVLGDTHGNVLVLGERDCSLQRRHQKVVEEAPAPGLTDELRTELHEAARRAAEAVEYVGAGTVEFLLDPERQQFFFLEMNTRLQVEHPVTECITGLDIVALQIAVAEGRVLADPQPPQGHAIEVRLYAEDPSQEWQPQSGRLTRFDIPGVVAELTNPPTYGIRLDSAVGAGDEIGTHYDAMIAKVVAWAPTRDDAARRLASALRRAQIHGLRTNRDLLVDVLGHAEFLAGDVSTAFLGETEIAALRGRPVLGMAGDQALSCFAAAVAVTEAAVVARSVQRGIATGWRNVVSAPQVTTFDVADTQVRVEWSGGRDGYQFVDVNGVLHSARALTVTTDGTAWRVLVDHDGVTHPFEVFIEGDQVDVESSHGHITLTRKSRFVDPAHAVAEGSLLAPMPGSVVAVSASVGDIVTAGQTLLVLEAMKMQHTITAPHDGVLGELPVSAGAQIAAGDVLAVVAPADPNGGSTNPSAPEEGTP